MYNINVCIMSQLKWQKSLKAQEQKLDQPKLWSGNETEEYNIQEIFV